jgi:hypothetical protein
MPEAVTATVGAATIAKNILPTTLLLLYFITPPAELKKGETKTQFEARSVWTLQSTVRIDFNSPDACKKIGTKMIDELEPVITLTVRAYCICENGDGQNKCPNDTWNALMVQGQKSENTFPTLERLGKSKPSQSLRRP